MGLWFDSTSLRMFWKCELVMAPGPAATGCGPGFPV
jgi:hypothetical protein